MDQKTLLEELRKGITPLPPIRSTRSELAPGWGRHSVSQVREAFQRSESRHTPAQLNPQAAPFTPMNQVFSTDIATGTDEPLAPLPQATMAAQPPLKHGFTGYDPEHQNCCILVTGLPGTVTVTEFIHEIQIRTLGKIAAVCINPPTPFIPTAAVKVTMWDREGADRLFSAVRSHKFGFDRHKLNVYWNRIKVLPQNESHRSRVIQVTGHPRVVAPCEMLPWFERYFRFNMDGIVEKQGTPEEMTVEYRFSSYLGQSHNAYVILRKTYPWKDVSCVYRKDPCEPSNNDLPLHRPKGKWRPKKAIQEQEYVPSASNSETKG